MGKTMGSTLLRLTGVLHGKVKIIKAAKTARLPVWKTREIRERALRMEGFSMPILWA
jgi:hypothetical protein